MKIGRVRLARSRFCFVNESNVAFVLELAEYEEEISSIDNTINEVEGPCQCPLLKFPALYPIVVLGKRISITVELFDASLRIGSHPNG